MMMRVVRLLAVAAVVGGVLFLFILPGRTWLNQSHDLSVAERQQAALSRENQVLSQRIALLQTPSYIEQIARSEYGLVMPGENAYAILPPTASTTTTTLPPKKSHQEGFWQSLLP
jgi:cell division protein FtsB